MRVQLQQAAGTRLRIEPLSGLPAYALQAWNDIVAEQGDTIQGLDVTATWEWARILSEVFLADVAPFAVVLEEASGVAGSLPLFVRKRTLHSIPCRVLSLVSELHAGRSGLVVKEASSERFHALLDHLAKNLPAWDVFTVTVVADSPSERLLLEAITDRRWTYAKSIPNVSPFIRLAGSWDEYYSSIDSKFRSRLRSREKKLRERGEFHFEVIDSPSGTQRLLDAMFQIEQESWKQSEGTAITAQEYQIRVYRTLAPIAAERGWLRAHLLQVAGEPVGYLLGLLHNGSFCGLKQSYKEKYKDFYPGHLIQMLTIKGLHECGARCYDMMGACEPHKMVWTKDTYSRSTYTIYNSTPKAWLVQRIAQVRQILKRA